jgi:hypothetical protein
MKKLLFAVAFVVLAAATANAEPIAMRVTVPFAFYAGDGLHPAGEYLISVSRTFRAVDLRRVEAAVSDRAPLKWAPVARKTDHGAKGFLRFARYGDVFALRSVWIAGVDGYELIPSKVEAELAKNGGGASGSFTIQ